MSARRFDVEKATGHLVAEVGSHTIKLRRGPDGLEVQLAGYVVRSNLTNAQALGAMVSLLQALGLTRTAAGELASELVSASVRMAMAGASR